MTKKPKKSSADYRKGFAAGVAALKVSVVNSAAAVRMIHGAAVYVLADFHLDSAESAALSAPPAPQEPT